MRFHQRIRTIYEKELLDILRDHRTLIAMIVVPIVLYPLLMLGSVQAVSYQVAAMEEEVLLVAVLNESQQSCLEELMAVDRSALQRRRAALGEDAEAVANLPKPFDLEKVRIQQVGSVDDMDRMVRERSVHIGVVFESDVLVNDAGRQNHLSWHYDKEDIRSHSAMQRLDELIERVRQVTVTGRMAKAGLPLTFDEPFVVTAKDLSSPPSILGQILPLILVLMTITGAIYPAIDLTAGERERGTLESLMACPVPVIDLIVGKFLVVTTVAIMGAALNLGSVTATVYFGGFSSMLSSSGGALPLGTMALILLTLIPFAVLMSAIMIAVCSFARTFKEAQNYVTPVILAVLIPGGLAALPATRLEGIMVVMPVGNMVLLSRDLLLGANIPPGALAMVLLSTTLYAGAAVAIAAGVFGRESVVFSDAASLGSMFRRSMMKSSGKPSVSATLLFVALLFPAWFFLQGSVSAASVDDPAKLFQASGVLMPVLFVLCPLLLMAYCKTRVVSTLSLRAPALRYVLAAALIGCSAWIPAHEINVLQERILGAPQPLIEQSKQMATVLKGMPVVHVLFLLAVVPAICEETLFRGFLLSGIAGRNRRWTAILLSAAIFGVFHFHFFRFPVTAGLGVVLGLLCLNSGSIVPSIIIHALHNALGAIAIVRPDWLVRIGLPNEILGAENWSHLPLSVMILGIAMMIAGLFLMFRGNRAAARDRERLAVSS